MLGTQGLLADGKAAPVERLGLGVAALPDIERGKVVEDGGDAGVLGT